MERCEIRTHSCRIILGTMLLVVLLLLCAGQAHAETVGSGTCGEGVTWTLDDEGTLTISGSGAFEEKRSAAEYPWYQHKERISKLVIEEGITEIGPYAFNGYSSLRSAAFPASLQKIRGSAFGSSRIEEISFSEGLTRIETSAFAYCSGLTALDLPDTVSYVGYDAFERCNNLRTVHMPKGLKEIDSYAFKNCSLEEITIPQKTARLGAAIFEGCNSLRTIRIRFTSWNRYTRFTSPFYGFTGTIYYPANDDLWTEENRNFWSSTAKWIESDPVEREIEAEGDLSETIHWTLDDAGTLVISGSGAIPGKVAGDYPWDANRECIRKLIIGEGVTEIGENAFCRTTPEIVSLPSSLEKIGASAFASCWFETIQIPEGVTEIGQSAFGGCRNIEELALPVGLKKIGDYAFGSCTKLKMIDLPAGLKEIGKMAFRGCSELEEIMIPQKVTAIDYAVFESCSALETIRLRCSPWFVPGRGDSDAAFRGFAGTIYYPSNDELWDEEARNSCCPTATWIESDPTDPVERETLAQGDLGESIQWKLEDGGKLTISGSGSIDQYETAEEYPWYEHRTEIKKLNVTDGIVEIGNSVFGTADNTKQAPYPNLYIADIAGSVEKIGESAFQRSILRKITLSQGLKEIGPAAFASTPLKSITLPDSVGFLGAGAFSRCSSLTSIGLSSSLQRIEKSTFSSSVLQSIEIPEGVTEIGEFAFSDCKSLEQIKLPGSLEKIEYMAFRDCGGLTEMRLPEKLTEIDKDAFNGCRNIQTVRIDTYDHWCRIKFPNYWEGHTVVIFSDPLLNAGNRLIAEEETGSVKLSEGITQIPAYTFRGNDKLTSIELPKSLKQVGAEAFDGCSGLKEVEVKNLASWCNTAFETAGSNPLNAASDAVLQIGGGTGTKVALAEGIKQVPDRTFAGWDMLSEVTLPESLKKIGAGAFLGCNEIKTVNVASMGSWLRTAFATESSSPLNGGAQLRVKNGDTYNAVTELEIDRTVGSIPPYAFSGTKTLKTAVIPEGVTQIGAGAFAACSGLTEVSLPETVTALEEKTFSGCKELKKILIPQTITRIEYDAFSGCAEDLIIYGYEGSEAESYAKARGITFLPYTEYDAIRAGKLSDNIKWTLSGGTTLTIEGSGSTPDYAEGKSPFAAFAGQVSTVKLKGVTGLGEYLLQDFTQLKRIDVGLETKLNQIDPSALSGCGEVEIRCYGNCYDAVSSIVSAEPQLQGITVTKLSGSSAGNVTWTYNEDTGTILLTSNGADSFGETFTESPFAELKAKRVQFSDAFSCSDIPANLFKDCTTISEVQLPQQVKTIGEGAFQGCTNLQTLSWYGDITRLGESAFQGCTSLKEIRLSGSVTMDDKGKEIGEESAAIPEKVRQIPAGCFSGCSALKTIDWYEDPEDTAEAGSIGAEAFLSCSALSDISIPDHVGAIGDRAFSGCENLTDREFSETLQEIGAKAFYGCTRMKEIRFDGDLGAIGTKAIGYYNQKNKDEVQQGLRVVAPEDASNIKNYCSANDIGFVTTSGIIDGDPDQKVYVSITSSVTVKKGRSKSVKYSTNGKVKKVTSSGGGGIVSVTRSGSKIKFRGLRAGNATVHLKFKMKGAGSISKTVYVKVKKSSASLRDGEAQNISVKQRSLTFASDAEGPQKISVSGVQTSLQASLSKAGIAKVSTNGTNTVTVTPLRSGQVDLTLQAAEDDVFLASGKVTIRITVKARPKTVTARAKKLSKKKAKVTWKKISGASSYQVQVATKKNFKGKKTYTVKAGKANTLKKTVKLKKGKKNYIRVRYLCKGKYSKWSRILTVKK